MSPAIVMLATAGSALVVTQSSICAPLRDWLAARHGKLSQLAAKLVSCPMCSGFWLGGAWGVAFGARDVHFAASAFAGSLASALLVATWLALGESYASLGLWRFLKTPKPAEEPGPLRVPRFMTPAWHNPWEKHPNEVRCACGAIVGPGQTHAVYCEGRREPNRPPGTLPAYLNFTPTVVTCGCGRSVTAGEAHVLTERCGGVTSLDR